MGSPKASAASLRGDANGDGEVSVADVMATVNYILGKQARTFDSDNADMNGDGEISITDVMRAVSLIVNGDTGDSRDWQMVMDLPSPCEIASYNNTSSARSPYVGAWFWIGSEETFNQFSMDFKADYIPPATYCSPFNFHMDYSSLLDEYVSVDNGGNISVYGGLQRQKDGDRYNAIISLWDVYCKKASGVTDTIRATLVEPTGGNVVAYSHEGNGVSFRPDFPWKPQKWYRMLIQLGRSTTTGNTTLEQWIGDLSEKKWQRLCIFDLGAPDLKFKGNAAAFLENFSPTTAGDIRTMECRNVRYYSLTQRIWMNVNSAYLYNDTRTSTKKSGSYQYGTDNNTFWMITTGVPDCATPQSPETMYVVTSETGSPLTL